MDNYSERLHRAIPGGCHTYSKGDDQFPDNAPSILSHGKDSFTFDMEGNRFVDYGMGLRSITVGYDNEEINAAAFEQIRKGNNLTRPSFIELEAAELLIDLIPHVEMVKFAKNGSSATSAAIKLARAYTGKEQIVRCLQHPFFSYDDWFIGSTSITKGVTKSVINDTLTFNYNDIESLKAILESNTKIAAVILEPVTTVNPTLNFLQEVKKLCEKYNIVFILDEMISGFRFHIQGACKYFDIEPDLVTYGKGMANGYSVAAIGGKREIMQQGGIIEEGQERLFLVSTTHGAEMAGLGAFKKTMEIYQRESVIDSMWSNGKQLMDGVNNLSKSYNLQDFVKMEGYSCSPVHITNNSEQKPDLGFRTLLSQELIKKGVLMPYISIAHSHNNETLDLTLNAFDSALKVYKKGLEDGLQTVLQSKIIKPVFRKYN